VAGPADVTEVELQSLAKSFGPSTTIGPVSLTVGKGELLSLVGPSGCGKTTILRMIAGFVTPGSGRIRLRGTDITGVPPHRRQAALVFQNYALFPHLDVFDNIAFGLRRRGVATADIARRVQRLIGMMRLDDLGRRMPKALSGGQQQRVALARALAIEPAVILLDEPFSSLDAKLRESTRFELRALQQEIGFTAIMVTHDQAEALAISDRLAIMRDGRLQQVGTAQDVYYQPATAFVADFVGRANRVEGGILRPESIRIFSDDVPDALAATVVACAFHGAASEIVVRTEAGLSLIIAADGQAPMRHPPGSSIRIAWQPDAIITFGDSK
jgi:putative spermidine/putrescine transport system ATP-binding protein